MEDGFEPINLSGIKQDPYESFDVPFPEGKFEALHAGKENPEEFVQLFPPKPRGPKATTHAPSKVPADAGPGPQDPGADAAAEAETVKRLAEEAKRLEIEQKAYDEGCARGEKAGYDAGFAEGKGEAHAEGFAEGEKEGLEAGFAKGEVDGFEAARAEAAERLTALASLIGGVESLWDNLIRANEAQIVSLVCKVAEKVVLGRVAVDDEMVKRAILDAFSLIPEPVDVTISVSPEDYAYIEVVKEDFFQQVRGLKQVSIVSDPSVARGGARVETVSGEVDAGIESRLAAVTRSVIEGG